MAENLLSPPLLEGAIPAFYKDSFYIPFKMNSTVGETEINGFQVKIKTIQGNEEKINKEIRTNLYSFWDKESSILKVKDIANNLLKKGSSYKVQLAYINSNGIVGLFSNVAIIKYLGPEEPKAIIKEGSNTLELIGEYQITETSEKLYSSYFIIRDSMNNIVHRTEEKIHNVNNDTISSGTLFSQETFVLDTVFTTGKNYYATFYCKTINGLELQSEEKTIKTPGQFKIKGYELKADLDFENARVKLELLNKQQSFFTGDYILARQNLRNPEHWTTIFELNLNGVNSPSLLWYDNTIEHGNYYRYGIFKLGEDGGQSEPAASEIIYASFEDMFLSDGERQLKIRFNPKITSLKNVIQEQKVDTIGGKYPYFFRNGYINYKEFPISGLITYLMDEDNLFFDKKSNFNLDEFGDYKTINLTDDNIYNERQFKMEVLNWLNNGKPKIFRSPSEGNYIVRLMNISLSPLSDGLNRMINTFSSTAYQIDDFNFNTLLKYELIKPEVLNQEDLKSYIRSYNLSMLNNNNINLLSYLPENSDIISLKFLLNTESSVSISINGMNTIIFNNFVISNTSFTEIKGISNDYSSNDYIIITYQNREEQYIEKNKITSPEDINIPCFQVFGRGLNGNNLLEPFNINKLNNRTVSSIKYIKAYLPNPTSTPTKPIVNDSIPGVLYIFEGLYYVKDSLNPQYLLDEEKNPEFKIVYTTYQGSSVEKNLTFSNNTIEIVDNVQSLWASPGVVIELGGDLTQYYYNPDTLENNSVTRNYYNNWKNTKEFFENNEIWKKEENSSRVDDNIIDYSSLNTEVFQEKESKHYFQKTADSLIQLNNSLNNLIK